MTSIANRWLISQFAGSIPTDGVHRHLDDLAMPPAPTIATPFILSTVTFSIIRISASGPTATT